jgi:hypothetical protein
MAEATAGTPVAKFQQPSGIVTKTIDAFSGMLPGPYTTKTLDEVFVKGTEPTQVDNTKVPVDIDADTNTLWTYDCPGTKVTKGFLDLTVLDPANSNFQKYNLIWIQRAQKGVGVRGGPNDAPTNYFYERSYYMPYGASWGAPFAPTATCTQSTGTAPPATPTPAETPTPIPSSVSTPEPTATPTAAPTATPTRPPRHTPAPSGVLLVPLGLWGLIGKSRMRQGRRLRRIAIRGLRSRH